MVPEKVPGGFGAEGSGEGLGEFGAEPGQVQNGFPEKVAEKVSEKVLGIFGGGPGQVQQIREGFQRLASQHVSERFATIKLCSCWGYRRNLFSDFVRRTFQEALVQSEVKFNRVPEKVLEAPEPSPESC